MTFLNRKSRIFAFISSFTAVSMILQWILIYAGLFPAENGIPGSRFYLMSFQLADAFMITFMLAQAISLYRNQKRAHFYGTVAGSGMLFFGLYASVYDYYTGQWSLFTGLDLYGRFVAIFNVVYGISLLRYSYQSFNITE